MQINLSLQMEHDRIASTRSSWRMQKKVQDISIISVKPQFICGIARLNCPQVASRCIILVPPHAARVIGHIFACWRPHSTSGLAAITEVGTGTNVDDMVLFRVQSTQETCIMNVFTFLASHICWHWQHTYDGTQICSQREHREHDPLKSK